MFELDWYDDAASVIFAIAALWLCAYLLSIPLGARRRRSIDRRLGVFGLRRLPGESNQAALERLRGHLGRGLRVVR